MSDIDIRELSTNRETRKKNAIIRRSRGSLTQRSKEPSVLAAVVPVLQSLLDGLLGLLALRDLLEGVVGHDALEALQLERVAGGHQVVVVDGLDEGLEAAALLNLLLAHAARHLERVALDAGDEGIGERVRLGALVVGLEDDDLEFAKKKVPSASMFRSFLVAIKNDDNGCSSIRLSILDHSRFTRRLRPLGSAKRDVRTFPSVPVETHISSLRKRGLRENAIVPSCRQNGHG